MKKNVSLLIVFYLTFFANKYADAIILQEYYELTNTDVEYSYLERDNDYKDFIKEGKEKGYKYSSVSMCIETDTGNIIGSCGWMGAAETQKESDKYAIDECERNHASAICIIAIRGKRIVWDQEKEKYIYELKKKEKDVVTGNEWITREEEPREEDENISDRNYSPEKKGLTGFLIDLDYIDEDWRKSYFVKENKEYWINYRKEKKKEGYKYFSIAACIETSDGERCINDYVVSSTISQEDANKNAISFCHAENKNALFCIIGVEGNKVVWDRNVSIHLAKIKNKEKDVVTENEWITREENINKEKDLIAQEKNVDKKKESTLKVIGTGSGFYVQKNGYVLTNQHVIANCKKIVTTIEGKELTGSIIDTDIDNDLALLKFKYKNNNYIKFENPILGEPVIAIGYPLADIRGDSVRVTNGIVSSIPIGQNIVQTNAAINQGNSGGPLLNLNGNAVGIVHAMLIGEGEDKFQNINYGIIAKYVVSFLSNNIALDKRTRKQSVLKSYPQLVKRTSVIGSKNTLLLLCKNTEEAFIRMQSEQKKSLNLLEEPLN